MANSSPPDRATAIRGGLTGQAAVYLSATIVSSAVPFLLLPLLTRWLGPADFGVVAVFVALVNMLGVVVGLCTHGLIGVVYFRKGPHALPPQAGAALAVVAAMSGLSLLLIWLFRGWLAEWTGIGAGWLWAVVVAAAGQFVQFIALTVFQIRGQPFRYATMQIGFGVALAALTILFIAGLDMDWTGRVLAQATAALLLASVGLAWLTLSGGISWSVRGWPVGAALAFGVPLIPHALGAMAMASVDRFALGSAVGPAAVGHYFVAAQLGSVLVVLATALNQAWLPWLYERLARGDAASQRQVVRATYGVFLLLLAGGALLALLAPVIVPLVAGPGFEPAIFMLRLLAPASAFSALYFFVVGFLFYEKRSAELSMITVTVAAIQAALSFTLVYWWGAAGVAWATLASAFLYWLSVWIVANRVHPMPWFTAPAEPPQGEGSAR